MRTHFGAIAIAFALSAATVAYAQSGGSGSTQQGANPIGRGDDVFFHSMQRSPNFGRFDSTGIGRPNPRNTHQVTPVPEPSQWALMLAGLALVGFIVRRSSRNQQ
jgi:hypothetical protein